MNHEEIVESIAICPKCKGINMKLIEVWIGHEIVWEQRNGKFDRRDGAMEPGGPAKVEGCCFDCGHKWTFRKIPQINYLIKSADHHTGKEEGK
jgi:hypothetical protein